MNKEKLNELKNKLLEGIMTEKNVEVLNKIQESYNAKLEQLKNSKLTTKTKEVLTNLYTTIIKNTKDRIDYLNTLTKEEVEIIFEGKLLDTKAMLENRIDYLKTKYELTSSEEVKQAIVKLIDDTEKKLESVKEKLNTKNLTYKGKYEREN